MLETIYIVRHAFRTNWSLDPISGIYTSATKTLTGIPTDCVLSAHGVEQSKELANHLCNISPPIDRVYSSPYSRCLQTLQPTTDRLFAAGKAKTKIRVERGFCEFFGRASTFQHPHPPTLPQLTPLFPNLDTSYSPLHHPHPDGELIRELHFRVSDTLSDIITALDNDPSAPKSMLICTHAAVVIVAGRVLTGNIPADPDTDDFQCYTAGLSRFERKAGSQGTIGAWECVLNSDTSFLSGGAERGWTWEDHHSVCIRDGLVLERVGKREAAMEAHEDAIDSMIDPLDMPPLSPRVTAVAA